MSEKKVCGTGAQCERACPLMLLGRDCPTPEEFVTELLEAQLSPAA